MGILVIVYPIANVVLFFINREIRHVKKKEYILPLRIILCDVEIKFRLKVTDDIL